MSWTLLTGDCNGDCPSAPVHPQIWLGCVWHCVSVSLACVPSSNEEQSADPPSPLSAKRRVLSRSALQSHQPVARPVAMGLSRYETAGAFGVGEGPGDVLSSYSWCDVLELRLSLSAKSKPVVSGSGSTSASHTGLSL